MENISKKESVIKRGEKKVLDFVDNSKSISAIRRGLILAIPFLLLGSLSLILLQIPVPAYQNFIKYWGEGVLHTIFDMGYTGTYGILSIIISFTVSISYFRLTNIKHNYLYIGSITSVIATLICLGLRLRKTSIVSFGTSGVFVALIITIIVCKAFVGIIQNLKNPFRLYADGLDLEFNDSLIAMIPAITIIIVTIFINYLIVLFSSCNSIYEIINKGVEYLFSGVRNNFIDGFFYVVVEGLLSFIGVQGRDILNNLSIGVFQKDYRVAGILSHQFYRNFVTVGGYGVLMCLLISIVLFGKRTINKNLAKLSILPSIFNVNEVLLYGFPVIYNMYLLAPFILMLVVSYTLSYVAFRYKLVPPICNDVSSTMPVILSGYFSTMSIRGALLQVVILIVGVVIYAPFVIMYDSSKRKSEAMRVLELTDILKKAEEEKEDIKLLELQGTPGALAKCLAADIKDAIAHKEIKLFYQLQYDNNKECIGAETLMRYTHPIHGFLYPPLVIKLADESGELSKLEKAMFVLAAKDYARLKKETEKSYKISVNITIATLFEDGFVKFLENLKEDYSLVDGEICIEVTEQMAIKSDAKFEEILNKIKNLGYKIAIDDFSMGSTSIKYLQSNKFDIVKLDGAIVKDMMFNDRSKDIISSIVYLAKSLDFKVLAEFVENEEQMMALKEIGCDYYQGYYFSKAVTRDEFIGRILQEERENIKNDR